MKDETKAWFSYADENLLRRIEPCNVQINLSEEDIAGSGMCTGGRIVDHLRQGLGDPKNDVFFVGYQAKGTPGRKMIDKEIPVKARLHTLTAYSAHADKGMLVDWVRAMPEPPKEIRLVHGEEKVRLALAEVLGVEVGGW